MNAPVIEDGVFTYVDVDGDTFTAQLSPSGPLYVCNETADAGTSVSVALSGDATIALGRFLASVSK